MAKFVTLERKHVWYGILAVVLLIGMGLISSNLTGNVVESSVAQGTKAGLKIVSVDFDPQTLERDLVYGDDKIDKARVLNVKSFKVSVVVQNVTDKQMTNIPVTLTVSLQGNPETQQVKQGSIASLEPGASARVTFENLKALGDAAGKQGDLGKHEMVLYFGANEEGGLAQATETKVEFVVDSKQK
ncbi:MAG: hypothetical protein FWG14_13565 [Peptococcaceae bacterium]|nr:hypothetical protein [Peptococcaceae bacterium]